MASDTRFKAFVRLQIQNLRILKSFFFKSGATDYKQRDSYVPHFDTQKRSSSFHDMELNFLLRVVLEQKYECVVEVGAFQGFRSGDLRRLLPTPLEVIASDLMYARSTDGPVISVPYRELFSYDFRKRTLFFCTATLAAMTGDEVVEYMSAARNKNADLAFVEPDLMGGVDKTIARSPISYFHPYGKILNKLGYLLIENNDTLQKTRYDHMQCLKGHAPEVWRMRYAILAD